MSYNTDIEYSLGEAEKLIKDLESLLEEVSGTDGAARRELIREIEQKLNRAKEYVTGAQLDIADLADEEMVDRYTEMVNDYDTKLQSLSVAAKNASDRAKREEQERAKGVTAKDLMGRTTAIQEQDVKILAGVANTLTTVQGMGNEQLAEIERQKQKLAQATEHMTTMDSELARARKVLKQMVTRAAGDNCIRVLAILVIIAVVAVVVVEVVKPGSVKKQSEGWFNNG